MTNQPVIVTAEFADDVELAQSLYRFGSEGTWTVYPESGVIVTDNNTIFFKAVDAAGNESMETSIEVKNIDKTPPAKPSVSADITDPTDDEVKVAAVFSEDSVVREFSRDSQTWSAYDGAVPFSENGIVYFRGTDAAGNESVTEYTVSNITGGTEVTSSGLALSSGQSAIVHSEEEYLSTVIGSGGRMYVSSGGVANKTMVNDIGWLIVSSGGTAKRTTMSGGRFDVSSGGIADITTVNKGGSMYVSSGGVANNNTVNDKGSMTVFRGGMASNNMVNSGGSMFCYNASDTTVNAFGYLYADYANSIAVSSGGSVRIGSGGTLTGQIKIENGASVSTDDGAQVEFDISEREPSSDALINNLSLISGAHSFSLCVSGEQKTGIYTLAEGVEGLFGYSLSVTILRVFEYDWGTTRAKVPVVEEELFAAGACQYGSFYIGDTINIENKDYTLNLIDSVLVLSVQGEDSIAPTISNVKASITIPTNQPVIVTADFADDVELAQSLYKLGENGAWTAYSEGGVTVSENMTVYFKAVDAAGNESEESFSVTNIDRTAPVITLSGDNVTPLQESVLTASVEDESDILFSTDEIIWTKYTEAITITTNATYFFKATDAAGNESTKQITFKNIDREKPTISGIAASTTAPAESLTVTAEFADNMELASKQYKIGEAGEWYDYPIGGVTVTENIVVYFKAVDMAGNETEASYEVTNIEKAGPDDPTDDNEAPRLISITANPSTWTSIDVVVTATFMDNVNVTSMQYKIGETGNWIVTLDGTATVSENARVFFQAFDAAGNEAEESFMVTNIDKSTPSTPFGLMAVVSDPTVVLIWNPSTDTASGIKEYVVKYSSNGQTFTSSAPGVRLPS